MILQCVDRESDSFGWIPDGALSTTRIERNIIVLQLQTTMIKSQTRTHIHTQNRTMHTLKLSDHTFKLTHLPSCRMYASVKWVNIGSDNGLRLDGAKPLSEPVLTYCQLEFKEHSSMKFYLKFKYFHSQKCAWTCCLRNGGHFVQGGLFEMYKAIQILGRYIIAATYKTNMACLMYGHLCPHFKMHVDIPFY